MTWGLALVKDDDELVNNCLTGDPKSYHQLVTRYQKKLFSVAYGMVHQVEDALDLVQEAFLKGYRNLSKFQGQSSFYTWIYRILINLCIDFLRKEKRQHMEDYDDTMQQNTSVGSMFLTLQPGAHHRDPLNAVSNKELGEQIWCAIQDLSDNHRAVIVLREIEGLSYEEIAATLGCSKGTVMSRLHHARARLRLSLGTYVEQQNSPNDGEDTPETQSTVVGT